MEKLRSIVKEIAYAQDYAKLSSLHRSLIPLLSFASSLYKLALCLRRHLYHKGLFSQKRLPVAVISVGNLTWGGNGKTPMVEFIASRLASSGILPLILTRGYGGGDEAMMLTRRLSTFLSGPPLIGVGANRGATACSFFQQYGYKDDCFTAKGTAIDCKVPSVRASEKIGAVILDDGMQICKMSPSHFIGVENINSKIPLDVISDAIVLCVSAIGSANAFVQAISKMGALYVDRLDFSDHHLFQNRDVEQIRMKLRELEEKFACKPVVVITEKDYDRDPLVFRGLSSYKVMALCSELQIIPRRECSEGIFLTFLKELLEAKLSG